MFVRGCGGASQTLTSRCNRFSQSYLQSRSLFAAGNKKVAFKPDRKPVACGGARNCKCAHASPDAPAKLQMLARMAMQNR